MTNATFIDAIGMSSRLCLFLFFNVKFSWHVGVTHIHCMAMRDVCEGSLTIRPCMRTTQLDSEKAEGRAAYAKSHIVAATAPSELGLLRKADGDEGFGK